MAQVPAVNTDELLSQLAASEIDRLLAEADGKAPTTDSPAPSASDADAPNAAAVVTEGPERTALLQAAGFQAGSDQSAGEPHDPAAAGQPTGDERTALLKAAGFESAHDVEAPAAARSPALADLLGDDGEKPTPFYMKPLIWINSPLDACPETVRRLVGGVALVTLVNALAVLGYVLLFRKH